MRILFVNEKCGYFGGVEQNIAVTARGLRLKGHQCFLAHGDSLGSDLSAYESFFDGVSKFDEICVEKGKQSAHPFEKVVGKFSPDVLYLHKFPHVDFCLPYLNKLRTVRMIHDHDLCCPRRHKYFFHNSRICQKKAGWRCYLDLAFLSRDSHLGPIPKFDSISRKLREMRVNYKLDRLLVGSRFMRDELLQNGFPQEKVHIVPPNVDMKYSTPSQVPQEPVILFVGQLIKGKGVDLLLQALARVSLDFKALVIGVGNSEPHLRELCRNLNLEGRVHFKGWIANESLGEFYAKARIVAVPSRWPEPFGMIGLEAMSHGRPVVAFDVGGIPDWLEHEVTGLLAPEQDIDAMANALTRLLSDLESCRRMGRTAFANFENKFSFQDYLAQITSHLMGQS